MLSSRGPLLRRRTAAGAALALAVATTGLISGLISGCDADDLLGLPAPEPDEFDADDRLADELAAQVAAARALAQRLPEGAGFVTAHDAHLQALGPSRAVVPASPSATVAPSTATVTELRAVEAELQRALAEAAVRAEHPGLARTLASISAGVAQLLAVAR